VSGFSALLDANVLYPAILRDFLMQFAAHGLFKPLWSAEVLNEVRRNLVKVKTEYAATFDRHSAVMNSLFPDAMVSDFLEAMMPIGTRIDSKDEHVLKAALTARAGAIVTANTKDFPSDLFDSFGIELIHPDQFLLDLFELAPDVATKACRELIDDYKEPPRTAIEIADFLRRSGCPEFAELLISKLS
jgi:predicted nucleic acid-binding protein